MLAQYNLPTAEAAKTLGRPLASSAQFVTVNLVAPGTTYGERLNQFDLRTSKRFTFGQLRTAVNFDIYNLLNTDTILTQSNAFATWQRVFKFNVQLDF